MSDGSLETFAIYNNDPTHVNKYVVKRLYTSTALNKVEWTVVGVRDTLAEAHALVPSGYALIPPPPFATQPVGAALEMWSPQIKHAAMATEVFALADQNADVAQAMKTLFDTPISNSSEDVAKRNAAFKNLVGALRNANK